MASGTLESDLNREMDDSGCVQDDSPAKVSEEQNGYIGQAQLLDLSDDVLLCILKFLSPHDLKALGYTCARLGSLVLERSLWTRVDARGVRCGRARARWLLQALHAGTRALLLSGRADPELRCLGHVNRTRKQAEAARAQRGGGGDADSDVGGILVRPDEPQNSANGGGEGPGLQPPYPLFRQHARLHINAQHQLPRMSGSPSWPDDSDSEAEPPPPSEPPSACPGPQFTLSRRLLRTLGQRCPRLTHLHLERCNINCNKTSIMHFPSTLKRLSLRGTKCYNLPLDKSFLFKIHDYLPLVEYLDLSECSWLEPAALLPLSKMAALDTLLMRDCSSMAEFVAYVSLATRYGFRKLRELDFSGSPVGDSEVSALGWLPALERLLVAAPRPARAQPRAHHHYRDDPLHATADTDHWEMQEPDYYRDRHRSDSESPDTCMEEVEEQVQLIRDQITIEVYTRPQEVIPEAAQPENRAEHEENRQNREENTPKRSHEENSASSEEPGSSKRAKTEESDSISQDVSSVNKNSHKNEESSANSDNNGEPSVKRVKLDNNVSNSKVSDEIGFRNEPGPSKHNQLDNNDPKGSKDDGNSKSSDNEDEPKVLYHFCRNNRVNIDNNNPKVLFSYRSSDDNDEPNSSNATPPTNEGDRLSGFNINYKTINISIRDQINIGNQNSVSPNKDTDKLNKNCENERIKQGENADKACANEQLKERSLDRDSSQPSTSQQDSSQVTRSNLNNAETSQNSSQDSCKQNGSKNHAESSPQGSLTDQTSSEASSSRTQSEILPGCSDGTNSESSEALPSRSGYQASTSSSSSSNSSNDQNAQEPVQQFVRFRQNEDPVVIRCMMPRPEHGEVREPERAEPRHHVLYVNLGQQLHAVYRLLPNRPVFHSVRNRNVRATQRLNASSLVSDSSIRHFGRSENANINIINIGPNGPMFGRPETGGRPSRSNLRYLSATGYRSITNRSLMHLATAAPHLEVIDFTDTGVTAAGVDYFKSLRPECEVLFRELKPTVDDEEEE